MAGVTQNADREILTALLRADPVIGITPDQWQAVAILARRHGVGPLLYRQLKTLGLTNQVPADFLQALRSAYLGTATRNLSIYRELGVLFERLQRANVPGVLLKGAYLAKAVYGDIAARPIGDIDLLAKKSDLARIEEIMADMGFTRTHQVRETFKEIHSFDYVHAKLRLLVEIHWDLIEPMYGIHVDVGGVWERSYPALVADIPVRALSPEDLILHLCIHTSSHVFAHGLRSMCDLAETLQRFQETVDWASLCRRARRWGAERCVYVNLWLANELLHVQLPDGVLNALRPHDFDPRYATLAEEYLFARPDETEKPMRSLRNLARFRAEANWTRKFVLLWQIVFLSRARLATMYQAPPNSWRLFLYYPVRMKDLVIRHSRPAWSLLKGQTRTVSLAEKEVESNAFRDWLLSA